MSQFRIIYHRYPELEASRYGNYSSGRDYTIWSNDQPPPQLVKDVKAQEGRRLSEVYEDTNWVVQLQKQERYKLLGRIPVWLYWLTTETLASSEKDRANASQ